MLCRTPVIVRPTSSGRRSRTTVSTSGSSGIFHSPRRTQRTQRGYGDYAELRRRREPRSDCYNHFRWLSSSFSASSAVNPKCLLQQFSRLARSRCPRPLRPLRRPLRPRNADGRPRPARPRRIASAKADPAFQARVPPTICNEYVGRPSPLYFAERLTKEAGGARIFLKREDLNHTGAHKINNCIGQALLDPAHGQAAHHRRDRGRPARRRHRHRRGPVRPAVPGLHGRGGRPPAEAQRLQDAGAGHRGRPGRERQPDAARRHQRGDARLDGDASSTRTTSSAASSARTRSR